LSQERSNSGKPVLEARDLSVIYGSRQVLDIPYVDICPNKVMAIIGPNGSGKTTLLLCLALLLKPNTGQILFEGQNVSDGHTVTRMRRRFAVVFQEPLLLNTTVRDNVTLGLKLRGIPHQEIKKRTDHWLERFGIAHLAERSARTLSGGEAQRASLARAFVLQPEVLFLDEPFSALDVPTRQSLFGDMVNILQETRFTTVMVTHDRNEAQTLAHDITMLINGKIVQSGSPREIFGSPANKEIAKFVGVENILEGTIISHQDKVVEIKVNDRVIEAISGFPEGKMVDACIRPEDVVISLARISTSARNCFEGRITSMISELPLVRVSLDCGFPLTALITRMSADNLELQIGKTVYASFKATAIHVIEVK
jgi:tungstate transport system ATP-binding protein